MDERAAQLEQSREVEARRRVAEERLRIAQDLHDTVAHSMATINVQAGVAEHVIGRHPERAREALGTIRYASGEVLDELAALVGLLRVDRGHSEPRTPAPGPAELDSLVDSVRRARLDVALRVEDDLGGVTQPIGVALYRIVQESLTNVVRHAGLGAKATVTVGRRPDGGVCVEVVDDGAASGAAVGAGDEVQGAGVGVMGMRERAEATGGSLVAGPRPEGGFVVRAVWPAHR